MLCIFGHTFCPIGQRARITVRKRNAGTGVPGARVRCLRVRATRRTERRTKWDFGAKRKVRPDDAPADSELLPLPICSPPWYTGSPAIHPAAIGAWVDTGDPVNTYVAPRVAHTHRHTYGGRCMLETALMASVRSVGFGSAVFCVGWPQCTVCALARTTYTARRLQMRRQLQVEPGPSSCRWTPSTSSLSPWKSSPLPRRGMDFEPARSYRA